MKRRVFMLCLMLAAIVSLLVIPAAAASGYTADLEIYGTEHYDEAWDVLELVNQVRAEEGLNPLVLDDELTEYAMQRAAETAVYFDHTRPDGSECFTVLEGNFAYGAAGENIAMGYTSASAVMNGWMNSEGHRANILTEGYNSIGVGCFRQDDGYLYWVQLFSSITSDEPCQDTAPEYEDDIDIVVDYDYLYLTLNNQGDWSQITMYEESSIPMTFRAYNAGVDFEDYVVLSGGYTMTVDETYIAKYSASSGKMTAYLPGVTDVAVDFDGGMLNAAFELEVLHSPSLFYHYNSSGNIVVGWDPAEDLYLWYKTPGSSTWKQTNNNNGEYVHSGTSATDKNTYILRTYVDGTWVNVGDELVTGKPAAPEVKASNVASSGKIRLTWDAVEGASGYKIYRSATGKSGSWSLLKTTTGTSFTNTGAEAGKLYYYYVKAVDADGVTSDSSNVVSRTCDLAQPVVSLSNVESSGKIRLTWDAVEGAVSYKIYRSTTGKDGSWSLLKTTTGTSFTNTGAVAGNTYYYKVRAVAERSAADSAYSAAKYRTCDLPRPTISLSNVASSGKIKVTWDAIDGAVSYKVYRSTTGKDGSWSLAKTTTGTSFTNTSAVGGVTYYYKVQAVASNSAANSAYSTSKYRTCDLARPAISLSNVESTGKIKVTWDAVEGAVSYKVYRSETGEDGTWSVVKTTTGTSFTNTGAVAGTTYYYKVQAIAANSAGNSVLSSAKYRTCDLARPVVTGALDAAGKPRLTWETVEGAVSYRVYRCADADGTYALVDTVTDAQFTDAAALSGETWSYKVMAVCTRSGGNSAYSDVVTLTAA